jgi:hypothetical protein
MYNVPVIPYPSKTMNTTKILSLNFYLYDFIRLTGGNYNYIIYSSINKDKYMPTIGK